MEEQKIGIIGMVFITVMLVVLALICLPAAIYFGIKDLFIKDKI